MTTDPRSEPARDSAATDPSADARGPAEEAGPPSQYVDFRALLLAEGSSPPTPTRLTEDDEHAGPGEDFRTALSRFRARLSRGLPPGETRTHRDMGTAYRTLGLGQEAIGEFQRAIRADPASPAAHEMLGRCFLDAGQPDFAVDALAKALELTVEREDDLLGIYYYMGRAQEACGNPEAAWDFYRKTLAIDIGFRDVEARARHLARVLGTTAGESAEPVPGNLSGTGSPLSGNS